MAEQCFSFPFHPWGLNQLNWEFNTKRNDLQPHVQHRYPSRSRVPAPGTVCCIFMEQIKSQGCRFSINFVDHIPLEEDGKQIVSPGEIHLPAFWRDGCSRVGDPTLRTLVPRQDRAWDAQARPAPQSPTESLPRWTVRAVRVRTPAPPRGVSYPLRAARFTQHCPCQGVPSLVLSMLPSSNLEHYHCVYVYRERVCVFFDMSEDSVQKIFL